MKSKGKRVAPRTFKLFRRSNGKRLKTKPVEENKFYQIIQLVSGKIKYFYSRISEKIFDDFEDDDYFEEEIEEHTYVPPTIERYSAVDNFMTSEEPLEDVRFATVQVYSLNDIDDILDFIENGCVVIANYGLLNHNARQEFEKRLSTQLMLLGTHLVHITNTEFICANREISLEDQITPKKEGKVYHLNAGMKR